jgi:O-antigen/teichoic acid export membrane protein
MPSIPHSSASLGTSQTKNNAVSPAHPITLSAIYLSIGQVATTGLSIVLTGAIGRSLGPADFGVLFLLTTIIGIVYVFVDWGYPAYIIREVSRHPHRTGELTGTVLVMRGTVALLLCIPAFIATWMIGYGQRVPFLTVLISAMWLPTFLLTSFSWAFRGRERMDLESLLGVTAKVLILGFTFAWIWLRGDLVGLIIAQGLAGACGCAFAMFLYRRLSFPSLRVDLSTARELASQAAPMFTMGLMISVQSYIDANMLARLAPADVVGWYGAAATLAGTLIAPAAILTGTVYPRLSRVTHDFNEFARLSRTALRPLLFVAVLAGVGTYLFADFAVAVVYRAGNFAPAGAVLRAFSPMLVLASIDMLLANTIMASKGIELFARAKIVAVVLTAFLELFLIPSCQARFGNGGIGVMLSAVGGEITMIGAAMHIMPRGTLDRRSLVNVAQALIAGVTTLVIIRPFASVSPFATIPFTVTAYTVLSIALGLITRSDAEHFVTLVIRRKTVAVPPAVATFAP